MGTTAPGPIHLLELCDQKLMDFVCNIDDKDMLWLQEIEEEAKRMFTREFSKEPELMPKTPSQKNRQKKRRVSTVQDENRDPIRKRLSRRKTRSSQLSTRQLRSRDKVEKLATAVVENGSPVLRRITRAAAAAAVAASVPSAAPLPASESPTGLTKKAMVKIGVSDRQSAEMHLTELIAALPLSEAGSPTPASQDILISDKELTSKKSEAGRLESVTVSSLMTTPQDPKNGGAGTGRSASKLKIAQASRDSTGSPHCLPDRVLAPILPDNCSTANGSRRSTRSSRRSLIPAGSQVSLAQKYSLAHKYSLVAKQDQTSRRSSKRLAKKATKEPAASARIICHSYLERLLNVEVPQKAGPEQNPSKEAEPIEAAETEVSKNDESMSCTISTPNAKPVAGGQETSPEQQQKSRTDSADEHREPPQSVRRKRSYKQAVSELDEENFQEDEELQPPRTKTPSPPCPANKVVRPLRTFLHTVQKNQLLMTPTSASRSTIMKSFIKRNTPLHMDPKCSFVEKERQRLENLRRKEVAEQLRRQKVEEDKRRRLEEVKLKREERLRKVLQARERVQQMKEEKKKQIEQKFAQLDEKTEKAKEERLAEEKAKKKAAAKRMEEMEARRKQEEEARRLKWLQQEEEERRHQELLQKKKEEEEQERLHKAAEARRLAEQRERERQQAEQERRRLEQERLQAEREKEKALRLQKERLQKELEEKKKEEAQRLVEQRLQEEQKKAKEEARAGRNLNVTVDVQSPVCTSYPMTPQGPKSHPKVNSDNYGMDLNSDDSTDDEAHPRKPIPSWARGTQLSQAIVHQYYHPPNLAELFGTILPLDLEDIFKKNKPRYHKRTSSAVWNSPPLQGPRAPSSLAYSLKY
ncbi:inner centromere protein isoform X2 [Perognathus longimembris pacificus]|uniref:inner centromere protein isoform X2 n=1 Tax=Perognathus longimembris pacificus TaxID=214514 RepID=UPI0020190FC8|nr:inner centromere protein isoform X2 [Perognathus longimembris pacificus]